MIDAHKSILEAVGSLVTQESLTVDTIPTDKEDRKNYLKNAINLSKNQVLVDTLSRITTDANNFIVAEANDMDAVLAHRAVIVVARSILERLEYLAQLFDQERKEESQKIEDPHSVV